MFFTVSICTKIVHFSPVCFTLAFAKCPKRATLRQFSKSSQPLLLRTNLSCIFGHKETLDQHTRCFSYFFHAEVVPKSEQCFFTILPNYSLCKMFKKDHFRHFSKTSRFFKIRSLLRAFFFSP